MSQVINVELLSDNETIDVLKLNNFNLLKPLKCEDCGHKADFIRKVFKIIGVSKDEHDDDTIKGIISSYIKKEYWITNIFFKSPVDKFYADSACCPKCQSTRIVFDIEFSDDLFRELSKLTGQSPKVLRRAMTEIAKRMERTQAKKH